MKLIPVPDLDRSLHGGAMMGALWLAPDLAKNLGIYLGAASAYEAALLAFYRFAVGDGGEFIEATFGRISNISARLEIIGDVLESRKPQFSEEEFRKFSELLNKARIINARRNELVHGTYWVYEKTQSVALTTWVFSNGRRSKSEWLTSEMVEANARGILEFSGEVMTLCGLEGQPVEEHLAWPKKSAS